MATPPLLDLESLLVPIAGGNPSGRNLAYDPEYDALREARRAEDDTLQGDWQRKAKTAQWDRVIELGCNVLKSKTKDLQIAAWIAEALTKLHGFAGLRDGFSLLQGLQKTFWDSCYPEIDDGDLEARQGPYTFLNASKTIPLTIRSIPLTSGFSGQKYSFLSWKESRDTDNVGLKNPDLMATLIAEGKLTSDKFDEAVTQTPRQFYEELAEDLEQCRAAYKELDQANDALFGRDAPSLNLIREAIDECRNRIEVILNVKRAQEPDAAKDEPEEPEPGGAEDESQPSAGAAATAATTRPRRAAAGPRGTGGPIASVDDARLRILEAAAYLRQNDPSSPVPYVVVRALRMGELYALAQPLDPSQCEAPSRETRQGLKRLAAEGDGIAGLELAEQSLSGPEGGAWLDAHRYAIAAMTAAGDADRSGAIQACRSLLRALLHDFPDLPMGELNDGTPTANAETRAWLASEIHPPSDALPPMAYPPPVGLDTPSRPESAGAPDAAPDVSAQAEELVRAGRIPDAIQLVRRAMNTAATGRERFHRKLQLTELCLMVNNHRVALPLSEDLARQVDEFRLEQWEDEQWSARVWAALYRCLRKTAGDGNADRLQQVFTRLCRLDINQALIYGSDS